jgi:hypothetical protein
MGFWVGEEVFQTRVKGVGLGMGFWVGDEAF